MRFLGEDGERRARPMPLPWWMRLMTRLVPARRAALREKAFAACEAKDWAHCRQWLDEATARDRYGEYTTKVDQARKAIAAALGVDAGVP